MLHASTVRPFATDDARVVYPRLIEIENFAEVATARGQKPSCLAQSLQGVSLTNRLEIIAGGFGPLYEHGQVKPVDLVFQPKYVLYRSFGAIPSVSVAAAELFPLSGNRQLWSSYAMAYVSWFLFMPKESTESKSWNPRDSVRRCEDARMAAKPVRRHTVYSENLQALTSSVSTFRSHVRRWRTFIEFRGSPLLPSTPGRTWNYLCTFSSGERQGANALRALHRFRIEAKAST